MKLKFKARTLAIYQLSTGKMVHPENEFSCSADEADYLLKTFPKDFSLLKEFSAPANKMYSKTAQFKSK